jgi:hypothetical protein
MAFGGVRVSENDHAVLRFLRDRVAEDEIAAVGQGARTYREAHARAQRIEVLHLLLISDHCGSPARALLLLEANVYSDHPDFDPEWLDD